MKTSTAIAVVVALIIVIGGAWYWWAYMAPASSTAVQQGTTTNTNPNGSDYQPGNLLLGTDATSTLGTYLIGSNGMTLYAYANDTSGVSNCTGTCATNWPPYTVGDASALSNIQAGIGGAVGSIVRDDGNVQVTYNGMPLYFYSKDVVSGDTMGQGVGGVWNVVTP